MADIKQYVNRSNLATFLAKIKELIPSSSSFLTKTEAEETYQGKLKYYTEGTQDAAISISYNGGASVVGGSTGGFAIDENAVGIVSAGLPIEAGAFGSDISFATTGNGDIKMTNNPDADGNKGKAYYNNSEILSEASVVDSLDSASTTTPLSANQGRVLNEKISDILPKSDVMTNTDVAMLSRVFALPLSSYVGAGLYQPSTDTIGKYTEMFNSLADGELVVCEYQGVKGLYKYQGGTQLYCFSQWAADLTKIPTGVEDTLTSLSTAEALSANQGRVLNEGKQDKLEYYTEEGGAVTISAGDTITLDNGDNCLTIADKFYANDSPVLTESTGIKSTAIRGVQYVSELPSSPSSDTLYLIPE